MNNIDNEGNNALHYACRDGSFLDVRNTLKCGFKKNKYGDNPLNTAVKHGRLSIIELLVSAKCPFEKNTYGYNPLHTAIKYGQFESFVLLLELGCPSVKK